MALFRRKKSEQTIAELENYYSSNRQTNTFRAWVMAFLSLLATIAVFSGVFLGGRWIYRTITDDSDSKTVTTGNVAEENPQEGSVESQVDENTVGSESSSPTQEGTVTDQAASTSTPSTSRPATGSTIPNTGADSTMIALPVIALVSGYIVSRKYQLK
jgi:hypothetical protein